MSATSTTRTSRLIAAVSLIAFPVLIVGANWFDHLNGSNAERVRAMAEHADSQALASILMYFSSLFMFAAVFAIGRLTLRATPKIARAAMTLGVMGAAGHVVLATYGAIATSAGKGDPEAMATFLDRVDDSAVIAPLASGVFLYGPAVVLLAVALFRAGVFGRVSLGLAVFALMSHMALPSGALGKLDIPNLLLAVVYGTLGLRIAMTSNQQFAEGQVARLGRTTQAVPTARSSVIAEQQ